MLDQSRNKFLPFFFGILFVQNTILLVAKPNTTKKIGAVVAIVRIIDIVGVKSESGKENFAPWINRGGVVAQLGA